ncbi:Fc.00g004040.m01.CDS01 [Cosmosporella sp. VM-42]
MARVDWGGLAIISLVGISIAISPFQRLAGNASIPIGLAPRQENSFDPGHLAFIKQLAAIGDSYSAGIGASDRLGGIRVNEDPRLGDSSKRTFQFESYSGAVIDDVIKKQVPSIDSNQTSDSAIRGNDAELVDILNQCIFQWAVFDWKQVEGCALQLYHTQEIIESDDFSKNLDAVLFVAKNKLASETGLMFYELNSWDPAGTTPWKRGVDNPENGTFAGDQSILAQLTLFLDPAAKFRNQDEVEVQETSSGPNLLEGEDDVQVEAVLSNLLPDGYGRIFHPQILLHQIIADQVIFTMMNDNERRQGYDAFSEVSTIDSCPYTPPGDFHILQYKNTDAGHAVKPGTELRILCVGDSITVGFLSDRDGGDGNGYRLELRKDLSKDKVVFAGTETGGSMTDGYFAAWSGTTIQYIADHVGPSLKQRPNIVLVHAGTNDMNPSPKISTEGNNPKEAADRLA